MEGLEITELEKKIESIKPELDSFKERVAGVFDEDCKDKISKALDKMISLHGDQKDRPDGKPYIIHPLEIATDLIEKYGIEDPELVIAALMHDSVEDQAPKLFSERMQRKFPEVWDKGDETRASINTSDKHQKVLSEMALLEIGHLYGERVKDIVSRLSNPDFDSILEIIKAEGGEKTKNDLYKEHVAEAIKDPDTFVIKYADFARNALSIDNLPDGDKKTKLIKKYGPVIKDVFLPAFNGLSEDHPLYKKRNEAIKELEEAYKKHYSK